MAEARAEFRRRDRRVDVGYWWESPPSCTERDSAPPLGAKPRGDKGRVPCTTCGSMAGGAKKNLVPLTVA
jgi:hypothetical protein